MHKKLILKIVIVIILVIIAGLIIYFKQQNSRAITIIDTVRQSGDAGFIKSKGLSPKEAKHYRVIEE